MIELIPVSPKNTEALQFVEAIYIQSFPADERRPFCEVVHLLTEHSAFHLTLLSLDKRPMGFISHWQWEEFAYIEHFAVDSTQRGSGYGAQGMQQLLGLLGCPVVLEVEPPVEDLARRRIGFYQRLGFELCNLPYTQPPYSPELQSVSLLLMSYGNMHLDSCFESVVKQLYREVYGVTV